MTSKHWMWAVVGAAVLVVTLGAAAAASGALQPRSPEQAQGPVIVPPLLAPPSAEANYVQHAAAAPIAAPDGRPVGQLAKRPPGVPNVSVSLPRASVQQPGEISYAVLASVRYTGNGHVVLVTTARASQAAAQQPAVYGNRTVRLADGSVAYVTTGLPGEVPNRVVQVRGDLVITVAGDLPVDELEALMPEVTVR